MIAKKIYKTSMWRPENENIVVRIIACGKDADAELAKQLPSLQQIELQQVIRFLHDRFNIGCNQINRSNWDHYIGIFADLCQKEHDIEKLKKWVLEEQNVQEANTQE